MPTISSSEFASNIGKYNIDVQRGPIKITSYGRPVGYYISAQEYEIIEKIRARMAKLWRLDNMPEEMHDAIMTSLANDSQREIKENDVDFDEIEIDFGDSVPEDLKSRITKIAKSHKAKK